MTISPKNIYTLRETFKKKSNKNKQKTNSKIQFVK